METIERTITSNEVAEMIGKEHSKLIRDIRTYIGYLNEAKIGSVDFIGLSQKSEKPQGGRPTIDQVNKI